MRYAETDQMGVVYHANYLAWCEVGRVEFIRERGVAYAELERRGVRLAVAEASIRYRAPARYDDIVSIATTLAARGSRTLTFDYVITHAGTGDRLVTARTTLVSLDASGRATALPPDVRRLFDARTD